MIYISSHNLSKKATMLAAISRKTAISFFVASPEPTARSVKGFCNHFFNMLSSSHIFYLVGAYEVVIFDDRDDAVILHRKHYYYRTNVLHVCEISFLMWQLNLMLHKIDANHSKDIFI